MINLLEKAIIEARKLPESAQDDISSILLSFVYRASENAGTTVLPEGFPPGNNGKEEAYDLEDVNVAIAKGIMEAKAHQRGEIELPNARETLEDLLNNQAAQ
uniref:Uncharacterized protein n=1 Tax=Candidatus Kentrum sp. FW TaxID=2126338 RepID=A0A450TG08_9GAMM|nr:MAG: hypothetical protein BECKFW1821A_GA0114235_111117 [Candidatus Kentron sp. FW]VFJ66158.1 MAG: hypothetical protein BECKFW1821B_GA0114236_111317 [Candidatus Kentron sp. FW]